MDVTKDRLDFWSCFFLRRSSHLVYKREHLATHVYNLTCKSNGAYITGSDEEGRFLYILICSLIFLVGITGFLTNVLNVILLRKSFPENNNFRESLVLLALIELVLSLATLGFTFFAMFIIENIDRGLTTTLLLVSCAQIFNITRTTSVSITVLITIERYLLIVFPNKYELYNRSWKSRMILLIVVIISILINLPWMCKSALSANDYEGYYCGNSTLNASLYHDAQESEELLQFPYLDKRIKTAKLFSRSLQDVLLAINFVLPLPVLLTFHALLYKSIYALEKQRNALKKRWKRNISAAKMFSFVAFVQFFTHSVSVVIFINSMRHNIAYIELFLIQRLSVVVSASANFWIYYSSNSKFKQQFWTLVKFCFGHKWGDINRPQSSAVESQELADVPR